MAFRYLRTLTTRILTCLALFFWTSSCGDSSNDSDLEPGSPPFERTEQREPCEDYSRLRRPFFGDLHVHTSYSADAYIYGTRPEPREAYEFARGAAISISDDFEQQTRTARLDRPLDFAAVTDHAEFYGESRLCTTEESPVYESEELCQLLRQSEDPAVRFPVNVEWLFPLGIPNPPLEHAFCMLPGVDCDAAAISVWQDIQQAAEEAYDRSSSCSFTTFVGYEHTNSPVGRHLHRNVIFRNEHVPRIAIGHLETIGEGHPQGLWNALERECFDAGTGCEAIIIPHNMNLSGGRQFVDPLDAADAQRRQDLEPLVEIHQQKANSECRFDRIAGRGVLSQDEDCTFEQEPHAHEGPDEGPPPIDAYPARNLVRNVLKDGLAFEQTLGVNPFKFGFIGSTDTHNATPGNTEEPNWEGGQGSGDSSPARQLSREFRTNPGGLAVVWAEENSRDAIFSALKRRETYATSGTRPVVRFFAGELDGVDCDRRDFVEKAYASGVPMGGDLRVTAGGPPPRFAAYAAKDPGTAEHPGADLQRIQIVKGWVDAAGVTHERVFEVAAADDTSASVDPATCAPRGSGASELCAVWSDPGFDPSQRAFYYARVFENPSCRWSTLACKSVGVDPFAADCTTRAAAAGEAFANCCVNESNDPFAELVVRERAWTSPIWYRPGTPTP